MRSAILSSEVISCQGLLISSIVEDGALRRCGDSRVFFKDATQSGLYRVFFDMSCDALFLIPISNPSIEIVARPKWAADAAHQTVGVSRTTGFDPRNNP